MLTLGLDVSTSVTGVALVCESNEIVFLDHIDFKKCKTFWEKTDLVEKYFNDKIAKHHTDVAQVFVEEPLMGFRTGMSSAATITMLMRFNGIVSHLSRRIFKVDPVYVSAAHARKLCGMKLQQVKKVGISHKEQVFSYMSEHDLKDVVWPKKKTGVPIDASRDMTDAYVIARGGMLTLNS